MAPVLRRSLSIVAGVVVAMAIVASVDALVRSIHPLPAGFDLSDPARMREAIASIPLSSLLLMVAGWALAAGAGAFVATRLTPDRWVLAGVIVAGLFLASTIANLALVPHPFWMWPAALIAVPVLGWAGIRAAARSGTLA